MEESISEYLTKRFKKLNTKNNQWLLHDYYLGGASYGIVLVEEIEGIDAYKLEGMRDGDYSKRLLIKTISSLDVLNIVECFRPTNEDFVYDS